MKALLFFGKKAKLKELMDRFSHKKSKKGDYYLFPTGAEGELKKLKGELRKVEIDDSEAEEGDSLYLSHKNIVFTIGKEIYSTRFFKELDNLKRGIAGDEKEFDIRKKALSKVFLDNKANLFLDYGKEISNLSYKQNGESRTFFRKITSREFRSFTEIVLPELKKRKMAIEDVREMVHKSSSVIRKHLERMVQSGLIAKIKEKQGRRAQWVYDGRQRQLF